MEYGRRGINSSGMEYGRRCICSSGMEYGRRGIYSIAGWNMEGSYRRKRDGIWKERYI